MSNTNPKLGRLAKLGLLAALSIVLVFFIHFPIFPTAKFLEYDPADIPHHDRHLCFRVPGTA